MGLAFHANHQRPVHDGSGEVPDTGQDRRGKGLEPPDFQGVPDYPQDTSAPLEGGVEESPELLISPGEGVRLINQQAGLRRFHRPEQGRRGAVLRPQGFGHQLRQRR